MNVKPLSHENALRMISFAVYYALSKHCLTDQERFHCRQIEEHFTRNMDEYIEIGCSVVDIENPLIFSSYLNAISRYQIGAVILLGIGLPVEFASIVNLVKARTEEALVVPVSHLQDRMVVLIGVYAKEKKEDLAPDSFLKIFSRTSGLRNK